MYMNAYAIHGTGDARTYESLYPAPLDDPNYPAPDLWGKQLTEYAVYNLQYIQYTIYLEFKLVSDYMFSIIN